MPDLDPAQLRLRLAVPAAFAVAALAVTGWSSVDRAGRAAVAAEGAEVAHAGADAFERLVQSSADDLGATLSSLGTDRELIEAVAARDVRRILAAAGPLYHDLRIHHGITHWNYWEPEPATGAVGLRNLVRLGAPTLHGDVVERETLTRSARDRALVWGIELGYTGFGLRAVAPVRDGARVVGYAELGRNIDGLLAEATRQTGDQFVVAIDKRAVEARRWAAARAAHGERNNWDDREDLVLAGNPALGAGVPKLPLVDADVSRAGGALGTFADGARVFARGAFPLRDAAGRRLGAVFVFRDATQLAERAAAVRRRAAIELAGVAALALVALGVAAELLVVRGGRPLRRPGARDGGPPRPT